ncbi:flavin reductase family protein [Maritimibacter alkaliphilus]|uniref:flavin reductase family protein n=1 Tax=Maritimibacter alkaliphilus TaxID=404236 RepID=UPI001C9813CA|nr:flavin reductase family protein [Maritimibacter alkaliphilus]MBY6091757.1 flavin reductase family protein [Maritimibacter alkaliphilus]
MFYEPKDGHGLPHNPFNAIVSPRPIGWISTRGKDGSENLAPYSFFNAVAYVPPQVMFASTSSKDSLRNISETGVFCANVVETAARDVMNATSAALTPETDEFTHAGIDRAECETIPCSRVANAPASLECRVTQIVQLEGADNWLILGEVTGVHIREDCLVDGRFDVTTFQALSRLGYRDYASVTDVFELTRPDD